MKQCNAPCPSGIMAEMNKVSDKVSIPILASPTNVVIAKKKILDWDTSFIINLHKGKDALVRDNYRGLKLTKRCLKVFKRVMEGTSWVGVCWQDAVWFCTRLGNNWCNFHSTVSSREMFIKEKKLFFAVVDREKAFNCVPCDILWWAVQHLAYQRGCVHLYFK